jgi:hypothetical protein
MLTARAARLRSCGRLLAVTAAATAVAVAASPVPARADSVRSDEQWVLDAVDAPAAWPVSQGSGVTVAVIDSGVVPTVDDLAGSVTTGPDLSGISTPSTNPNPGMHGTWMASLIAGHGHGSDDGDGISGVAPQTKVLSIRVLPDRDKNDPAYKQYQHEPPGRGQRALAHAITYAVEHHVSVISMSLGYGASSRVVRTALQDATRHNVVVVASAGNFGSSASDLGDAHAPYSYPANYPGVLGVAAVDRAGKPVKFSSDNLSVQVAAPGVNVPAQGSDGGYWLVSGTSPACALTAGVAALIRAKYPHLPPALVIRAITSSTRNRPPGGYNDRVGFGTVDAVAALAAADHFTTYRHAGHGVRPHTHFGGGPPAIPPSPVQPRGPVSLVLFCVLALACLVLIVVAASRLWRGRGTVHAVPPSPPTAGGALTGTYQPSRDEPAPEPVNRTPTLVPPATRSPAPDSPVNSYPATVHPARAWPDPGWPATAHPVTDPYGPDRPYGATAGYPDPVVPGGAAPVVPGGAPGAGPYTPGFPRDGGAGQHPTHQDWPATSWTWDSDAPSDSPTPPAHPWPGPGSPG